MFEAIFCIDVNTHICKKRKKYAKFKNQFFFKMLKFLLIFFIDIITPVISSTQIACDVLFVQHVIG